jgi:hypothetical protein
MVGPGERPGGSASDVLRCRHEVRLSLKVLFGLALRQSTGMVAGLLRIAGEDWPVPDHSSPCRRQTTVSIGTPFRRAGGDPNLLGDSTGVKRG